MYCKNDFPCSVHVMYVLCVGVCQNRQNRVKIGVIGVIGRWFGGVMGTGRCTEMVNRLI